MSNLETHEAEQSAITAMCEAGTCDHPDCHGNMTWDRMAQKILDDPETSLSDNRRKAIRAFFAIYPAYDDDTLAVGLMDALSDIRHLCDLAGINFDEVSAKAADFYRDEEATNGKAIDDGLRQIIRRDL